MLSLPLVVSACGNEHQGTSPTIVRIKSLLGASGATPSLLSNTLASDVITNVKVNNVPTPTVFADPGQVTMELALKDPGMPGVTNVPGPLNIVTFTHYRVVYRRTDGHNIQGTDVPYAFDSGLTFSVPPDAPGVANFEIVRVSAKVDSPLKQLQTSGTTINTIADVTFFGADQAGNPVQVVGSIGIDFANYGDPNQ
jgi:hypothetical protein